METRINNNNSLRLGSEDIKKLLIKFAVPGIASLVVVSLYNIVDRIYIGQGLGAMAISGLSLTLPISNMVAAIGTLIGVGAGARISIVLGKKDYRWARNILAHVPMLTIFLSSIFCAVALVFMDELLMLFGGSEQTLPYAEEYLRIIIPASVMTNLCFSLSTVIRSSGNPNKSMYVIMSGVVLNIILDPIFIFGFDMGIKGVAYATAISMFCGAAFAVSHFIGKDKLIAFRRESFKIKGYIIKNIISIGLSPFSMNFAAAFVALLINIQLRDNGGDLAIGAFGIINSYLMISVMVVLGFCQGAQPIIGFNYGAGNMKRVKDTFVLTIRSNIMILLVSWAIIMIFPRQLALAFVPSHETDMLNLVADGLRRCSLVLPFVAVQIVIAQFFMAISKAKISIIMSLSRQVLFLVPFLLIFPTLFGGINGVWYSLPAADTLASIVAIIAIIKEKRRIYGNKRMNIIPKKLF